MDATAKIEDLIGLTLTGIAVADDKGTVTFVASDGQMFCMRHYQDCCESVELNEIVGDLNDLIDSPITEAEEASNSDGDRPEWADESWTWTFYKLGTIRGRVTLRWLGSSNGYYSEDVDFVRIKDKDKNPIVPD